VSGRDLLDGAGNARRVVLRMQRLASGACMTCPILVCARKNCWRNGGKELWRALERRIEEEGLQDVVKLRAVDCLDRCKQGPNAEWAGHEFSRCRPIDAERIVEQAAGALR
jgi:NADH:ubiquinone oxidoreductase subunit E